MRSFRKLFELSWAELWLLAQATVLLSAVRLALKVVTVNRLQGFAESKLTAQRKNEPLSAERIAWIVRVAAEKGPHYARCLEQSLVLNWLLRRRGVDAHIMFGARKLNEQMEAHAWVEVNGATLDEDEGMYRDFLPINEPLARN